MQHMIVMCKIIGTIMFIFAICNSYNCSWCFFQRYNFLFVKCFGTLTCDALYTYFLYCCYYYFDSYETAKIDEGNVIKVCKWKQ